MSCVYSFVILVMPVQSSMYTSCLMEKALNLFFFLSLPFFALFLLSLEKAVSSAVQDYRKQLTQYGERKKSQIKKGGSREAQV